MNDQNHHNMTIPTEVWKSSLYQFIKHGPIVILLGLFTWIFWEKAEANNALLISTLKEDRDRQQLVIQSNTKAMEENARNTKEMNETIKKLLERR